MSVSLSGADADVARTGAETGTGPAPLPIDRQTVGQAEPGAARGWYVVAILMLVTLIAYLDRSLPALIFEPLRREFGASDGALGLLQGYGFSLVYTVIGLPLGRMVDVSNRRRLIVIGIAIWSLMTGASAFVDHFWQLIVTRAGVGIGEAVLAPAAYSIIADYFHPRMHGRALGVYFISLYMGAGVSLVLGATILGNAAAFAGLPILGDLSPWRLLFAVCALPGIPAIAIMLTVREPVRRHRVTGFPVGQGTSFRDLFAYMAANRSTFVVLMLIYISFIFGTTANVAWGPTFYARTLGFAMVDAGRLLGIATLLGGLVGCLAIGWISDRFHIGNAPGGRLRATMIAFAIAIPASLLWPMVSDPRIGLPLFFLSMTGYAMGAGVAPSVLQQAVPNQMRGKTVALYALIAGLLGSGFSPTGVALVAEHLAPPNTNALRFALMTTAPVLLSAAAILCWFGLRPYQATVERLHGASRRNDL